VGVFRYSVATVKRLASHGQRPRARRQSPRHLARFPVARRSRQHLPRSNLSPSHQRIQTFPTDSRRSSPQSPPTPMAHRVIFLSRPSGPRPTHPSRRLIDWCRSRPCRRYLNITAKSGAVSATTALTVTAATLSSLTLSPANPGIPLGLTQQLTAMGNILGWRVLLISLRPSPGRLPPQPLPP